MNPKKNALTENKICIFRSKGSRCFSNDRMNLPLLICERHLRRYFGLEVGYTKIDGASTVGLIGGFLKPEVGKMLKNGTVIIPTKAFFDINHRPHEISGGVTYEHHKGFHINPVILRVVNDFVTNYPNSIEHRAIIEMYRNLISTQNVDPGPTQLDEYPALQANVESAKVVSNVHIRNQPISKIFGNDMVMYKGALQLTPNIEISPNFQYLLNHCLYSEFKMFHDSGYYYSKITPNCRFIEGIGLVATQDIPDPHYLILDGRSSGSITYYRHHVSIHDKNIQEKKYELKHFIPENIANESWKGGNCPGWGGG